MKKHMIAAAVCLLLLLGLFCSAYATEGLPMIIVQPSDVQVYPGGTCLISADAENYSECFWVFFTADLSEMLSSSLVGERYPGLEISGEETPSLILANVPVEMDGWLAACTFTNEAGYVDSDEAKIIVMSDDTSVPELNAVSAEPSPVPSEDAELAERWYGSATEHWHEDPVTYEKSYVSFHEFADGGVNEDGEALLICSVCGYTRLRDIAEEDEPEEESGGLVSEFFSSDTTLRIAVICLAVVAVGFFAAYCLLNVFPAIRAKKKDAPAETEANDPQSSPEEGNNE